MHFIARSQLRSEVHSWLQSIVHPQPVWLLLSIMLTRCSQVHSRACSQGRSQLHSIAPSQPAWQTLPRMLPRCSQAHSRTRSKYTSNKQDNLTICSDICFWVHDPETYLVPGARHREAGGSGQNHDVGRYLILNLIFSLATATRSHDDSWSLCWQLLPSILQER